MGDAGLTGQKIIVDSYGLMVMTSVLKTKLIIEACGIFQALMLPRWVAKSLVKAGLIAEKNFRIDFEQSRYRQSSWYGLDFSTFFQLLEF